MRCKNDNLGVNSAIYLLEIFRSIMKKYHLFVGTAIFFSACSSPSASTSGKTDPVQSAGAIQPKEDPVNGPLADTTKVKAWLTKVITDYTNSEELKGRFEQLRRNLTDDYYHYKQGSLDLEYDSAEGADTTLTEEGWKKKWQGKFNTKYAGNGGYLISGQDNGQCQVTLHLLRQIDPQSSLYKVAIKDTQFNITYNRDIKVINQNGKLLIADILEYN
jgi:hypothetical protein